MPLGGPFIPEPKISGSMPPVRTKVRITSDYEHRQSHEVASSQRVFLPDIRWSKYCGELISMLHDEQIRIPSHPKISEDVDQITLPDHVMQVRGAANAIVVRGGSLLPFLIGLLDGTRDIEAIIEIVYLHWENEVGLPHVRRLSKATKNKARIEIREKIIELLTNLYMNGMLEDGEEGKNNFSAAELEYYRNQLLFFSRYVDVTRSSTNRYGLQLFLKQARVVVLCSGSFGRSLAIKLCRSGVGEVTVVNLDRADDLSLLKNVNPYISLTIVENETSNCDALKDLLNGATVTLVVVATNRPYSNVCRWLNKISIEQKFPWTVASIDGREATIGPTIWPTETGCYSCYRSRQKAASSSYEADKAYDEHVDSDASKAKKITELEHFSEMMASMFVLEILKIITFFSVPLTAGNRIFNLDLLTFDNSVSRFQKLPRCASCSPDGSRNESWDRSVS
jgi:thiazole/oxazole-forming peptide maturase SagC family component